MLSLIHILCLSHLGIQMDEHLVAGTHNIDVILGGHSHTFMAVSYTHLSITHSGSHLRTLELLFGH